jgi:hypothetical protein
MAPHCLEPGSRARSVCGFPAIRADELHAAYVSPEYVARKMYRPNLTAAHLRSEFLVGRRLRELWELASGPWPEDDDGGYPNLERVVYMVLLKGDREALGLLPGMVARFRHLVAGIQRGIGEALALLEEDERMAA